MTVLDNLKLCHNQNDIFYAITVYIEVQEQEKRRGEIFITKLKQKCKNIIFDTYGMFGKQPIWGEISN